MKKIKLLAFFILISLQSNAQHNFGMYANLNFPFVDKIPDMVSNNNYSYGAFFQAPFSIYHTNNFFNRLDYTTELGFNFVGFRDKQTDFRYNNYYVESGFHLNFIPDRMTDALRLFIGIRPSILVYQDNESFQLGTYQTVEKEKRNQYKTGDIDLGICTGISLSLGQVVRFETKYTWGSTSQLSPNDIKGKPSLLEFGLKLSAVNLSKMIQNKDEILSNQIKKLSSGTLLVMLETPNLKHIQKLIDNKENSQIEQMISFQNATNAQVKNAFSKYYNFSNVAYFYDSNAYMVSKGNITQAIANCSLNANATSSKDSIYFIASFCEDFSPISEKIDYGLYFYDASFMLLSKPFNIPANHLGVYPNGDPMAYFKRLSILRNATDFNRIVFKANARMNRLLKK
jgi:hypothetical protein